jgi:hypothetical protein
MDVDVVRTNPLSDEERKAYRQKEGASFAKRKDMYRKDAQRRKIVCKEGA